jgi:hypothetical protein
VRRSTTLVSIHVRPKCPRDSVGYDISAQPVPLTRPRAIFSQRFSALQPGEFCEFGFDRPLLIDNFMCSLWGLVSNERALPLRTETRQRVSWSRIHLVLLPRDNVIPL